MTRYIRAQVAKSEMREIADKLITGQLSIVNSTTIVDHFLKKKIKLSDKEESEILLIGLNVIAGQIGTTNSRNKNQYELHLDNNIREFTPIFKKIGDKTHRTLTRTLDLTPDIYFGQSQNKVSVKVGSKASFKDELENNMKKMRDLGRNNERYEDFLKKSN